MYKLLFIMLCSFIVGCCLSAGVISIVEQSSTLSQTTAKDSDIGVIVSDPRIFVALDGTNFSQTKAVEIYRISENEDTMVGIELDGTDKDGSIKLICSVEYPKPSSNPIFIGCTYVQ